MPPQLEQALAQRVTVGVVTALPEERAAMLAMLNGRFRGPRRAGARDGPTTSARMPAHGGGRHVVALALAGMGNNVAAARRHAAAPALPRPSRPS